MIPLRPELVEFMDPRSLCRYACTSKTLCKDVRDLKAWDLLAIAQVPRSVRGPSALARVQSHVRRRRLADELWQDDPPQTFHPNGFGDFSYFVRFSADDGKVIWEGELARILPGDSHHRGCLTLDLADVWSEMKQSESWDDMEAFLRTPTDDAPNDYLHHMSITVVAIRDEDQAMVSLGRFLFVGPNGVAGHAEQEYIFRPHEVNYQSAARPLFSSARFELRPIVYLTVTHDTTGDGTLEYLELWLEHYSEEALDQDPHGHMGLYDDEKFTYLLSYLAGVHHHAREQALATIENWHVEAAHAGMIVV